MAKKARVYTGTEWVDLAAATTDLSGYPALSTNQFGFRNKIINGDFRINQRAYTSASNLASGSYGFDRWKSTFTNTTLTFTSAPQGQMVTINSGGSVEQVIERENMPAGTYVLSWTGTATGRVYNTGATPPSYAASPILVTLDGSANVEVEFTASGGTRTLQNVQLEPGNVASAFEQRPIGTELALCQRYYVRFSGPSNYTPYGMGSTAGTTSIRVLVNLPITMRVPPNLIDFSNLASGQAGLTANAVSTLTIIENGNNIVLLTGASSSQPAAGSPITLTNNNTTAGYLAFGAEL